MHVTRPLRAGATTVAVALALAATGTSYAGAGVASTAKTTCHGQPATIVGTPGGSFQGTPDRDVIVTNDAVGDAGEGDDLICLTGPYRDGGFRDDGFHPVDAGPGDDVVDASSGGRVRAPFVDLGTGADHYVGSGKADVVDTGSDTDTDTVRTGAGADAVVDGGEGLTTDDRIVLGAGDDVLIGSGDLAGGRLSGGRGKDRLEPSETAGDSHLLIDPRHGVLRFDVEPPVALDGFENYHLQGPRTAAVTFRGTASSERLRLSDADATDQVYELDAEMGAGDDSVEAGPCCTIAGRAEGGSGHDSLGTPLSAQSNATIDVGASVVLDGVETLRLGGFERTLWGVGFAVPAPASSLEVVGTPGDDDVTVTTSVAIQMRGRGGNDSLGGSGGPETLLGGPGNDVLIGTAFDDVLVGGRGHDHAFAWHGTDRCAAEVERDCELSVG